MNKHSKFLHAMNILEKFTSQDHERLSVVHLNEDGSAEVTNKVVLAVIDDVREAGTPPAYYKFGAHEIDDEEITTRMKPFGLKAMITAAEQEAEAGVKITKISGVLPRLFDRAATLMYDDEAKIAVKKRFINDILPVILRVFDVGEKTYARLELYGREYKELSDMAERFCIAVDVRRLAEVVHTLIMNDEESDVVLQSINLEGKPALLIKTEKARFVFMGVRIQGETV